MTRSLQDSLPSVHLTRNKRQSQLWPVSLITASFLSFSIQSQDQLRLNCENHLSTMRWSSRKWFSFQSEQVLHHSEDTCNKSNFWWKEKKMVKTYQSQKLRYFSAVKNPTATSFTNKKSKTGSRNRSSMSYTLHFLENKNRYFSSNNLESLCSAFALETRRVNKGVHGGGEFSDLHLRIFGYGPWC